MTRISCFYFIVVILLFSCRGIRTEPTNYAAYQESDRPHMLVIFMDGTRDMPHKNVLKNSHVKNIHELLYPNVRSLYIEGVGAGNRLIQAKNASTTSERVMKAYRFLSENYKSGDSIAMFGFSRGANQCRILSGLIYTIGIIDLNKITRESEKQQFLLEIYNRYADMLELPCRKDRLARFINHWNSNHAAQEVAYDTSGHTMIELIGLWDTVEALEIGDTFEIVTPVPAHLNQLYNVKKLFHAVSLDDNRAFNYSPILATHKDVALHPHQNINTIVEEVWFNGSHKDVGGGHKKGNIRGVSLNWMLSRVRPYNLFKNFTPEINEMGTAFDMRRNKLMRKLSPGDTLRGINKYWQAMNPSWNNGRIKVHQSVINRLSVGKVQDFKIKNGRLDWYDWEPFRKCFITDGAKRIFKADCDCIEVVSD
jgi:uncharacterized protein (DUF2235 family)